MKGLRRIIRATVSWLMGLSLFNRWLVFCVDLFLCLIAFLAAAYIRHRLDFEHPFPHILAWGGFYLVINSFLFYVLKSYRGLIRHSNFQESWRVFASLILSNLILLTAFNLVGTRVNLSTLFVANLLMINVFILLFVRLWIVLIYYFAMSGNVKKTKGTLIYGIGNHSISLSQWITRSEKNSYYILGFLVGENRPRRLRIHDLPLVSMESEQFGRFLLKNNVCTILFPDYASVKKQELFVTRCLEQGFEVMVAPPFEGVSNSGENRFQMRAIQFEDLLGRDEIKIDMARIGGQVAGKVILITGAAGSIGSELVRQLATFNPQKLILLDVAETPLHNLRLELELKYPQLRFDAIIGDIRNMNRMNYVFKKFHPNIVYHAAAYKHVPMMEENPCEAILVNVLGTKNLSTLSAEYNVDRFVMISTDKAVNPTNIMGASKRMAEIFVQSFARKSAENQCPTQFVTTRFGNVLGSNGSVIPHFKAQIERGGPVTVTHPDIIRYFMTIPEACRLVLEAASFGKSGEIYVFDMGEPVKIIDLARKMIELAGLVPDVDIPIQFTGLRPGEKLYEELLNDKEKTLPTEHEKITVALVRLYNFNDISAQIESTIDSAAQINIPDVIRSMKNLIPEFKSMNSPWEVYDCSDSQTL